MVGEREKNVLRKLRLFREEGAFYSPPRKRVVVGKLEPETPPQVGRKLRPGHEEQKFRPKLPPQFRPSSEVLHDLL